MANVALPSCDQLRSAFVPWLATVNPDSDQPVRRVARWADLPAESRPLLKGFVARRLVVTDTRDGEVVVEVALESLLRQWDELATWLAEERGDLKDADHLERAAAAWEENHRDAAWLVEGTRLVEAENLSAKPAFRDRLAHVHDFLAVSRRREQERTEAESKRRAAELQAAKDRQEAAEALAAAETTAREKAQAHATVLRKRSLVLRAVLAVALLIAAAAVYGFVTARRETDRANERTREALGLRLTYEGQAMLAGIQGGGDIRALTQILAAQTCGHRQRRRSLHGGAHARRHPHDHPIERRHHGRDLQHRRAASGVGWGRPHGAGVGRPHRSARRAADDADQCRHRRGVERRRQATWCSRAPTACGCGMP